MIEVKQLIRKISREKKKKKTLREVQAMSIRNVRVLKRQSAMRKSTQFNLESHDVAAWRFQNRARSRGERSILTSSIDWPIKSIRSRRKIEITAMRVNTGIHVARFDVEVDLYGSHAIAIILRAITMPFEVFIFPALVGNGAYRGILYFNTSRFSITLQKSSGKLALPNRESATDLAIVMRGYNLSRREITSHAGLKVFILPSVSFEYHTFRCYVIFRPLDTAKKK